MGYENIREEEGASASAAPELSPREQEILGVVAEINRTEHYIAELRKLPQTERTIKNISEAQKDLDRSIKQKESLQKAEAEEQSAKAQEKAPKVGHNAASLDNNAELDKLDARTGRMTG